jgi:cell division protein FtsZ
VEEGALLIAGVGGLGCAWARAAHSRCSEHSDLLLIDADPASLADASHANCIPLGNIESSDGCASMPELARGWLAEKTRDLVQVLDPVEMVIILTALGGGAGTGGAHLLAERAKAAGALVITVVATPFDEQVARLRTARAWLPRLEDVSHACIRLSLPRLAWRARERGVDWQHGGGWMEDLIDGLIRTQAQVGLINLDLMDLRSILERPGRATMLVAQGRASDASRLVRQALAAPLENVALDGAAGCLIQVEGGMELTLGEVNEVTEAFTARLHPDSQVIFGARMSPELDGEVRVVAVLSGL